MDAGAEPHLSIRRRGGEWRLDGAVRCTVGRRVPRVDGRSDGIFAEWNWDGTELQARTDPYGIQPLYYACDDDGIALSPSLPRLIALGISPELDDGALGIFLRRGYFLGEDTPFRAIRALPPDGELTWQAGRLQISGGLTLRPLTGLDRAAALDAFIDLFRRAVRRRAEIGGDCVLGLSGGQDSRHILFALVELDRPPRFCATYRSWWGEQRDDLRIARRVAAVVGVPHVTLPPHGNLLAAEQHKNLRLGFSSYRHAQALVLADHLRGRGVALWDGLGGDLLARNDGLNRINLELMEQRRFEHRARALLSLGDGFIRLLRPEAQRRFALEPAVERMTTELARHAEAPNPVGSFVFWNLLRREVGLGLQLFSGAVDAVYVPYLDRDVFDLLASLPARMLLDHRFHGDAMARAYPRWASLPFAVDRWTRTHSLHVRHFAFDIARDLSTRSSNLLAPAATARALAWALAVGRAGTLRTGATDLSGLARIVHLAQLERFAGRAA